MDRRQTVGRISSVQTLGALDGPGLRFVTFLQGCPLSCGCCHNPEARDPIGGKSMTAGELFDRVMRYREYFGEKGGITLSGGEPLMQSEFSGAVFSLCSEAGIDTCLDTSGYVCGASPDFLLKNTRRVLLDVKYTDDCDYRRYAGCGLDTVLGFLARLDELGLPTVIRQVVLPGLNDSRANYEYLAQLMKRHGNVERVELLPFVKLCRTKYKSLHIPFPFEGVPEPDTAEVARLQAEYFG